MAQTEFFKCYGATERADELVCITKSKNYLLIFGFGSDDSGNYSWRKYYDHRPTESELKRDIEGLINGETYGKIVGGYTWEGKPVYLTVENQMNFNAAYSLARDTEGATLPVTFKLGEDEDGEPVFHIFTRTEELGGLVRGAEAHIQRILAEGWEEKRVDYSKFYDRKEAEDETD